MSEKHLVTQPLRKQALIAVRQLETETRLACTPERRIKPIVTALPRVRAHQVVFTPNGKWVVVRCTSKVFVLAMPSGKCIQVLAPRKGYFNTAALSPNGEYIATGEPSRQITLWHVHTGEQVWATHGHSHGGIGKVAITPDNSKVLSITLSKESDLGVWDLRTGELLHMTEEGISDFAIAPDGQSVLTVEGDAVRVRDIHSGRILKEYNCGAILESLALSADGKTAVVLEGERNERFWIVDLLTGVTRVIDTWIHHEYFALHPGGEMLVAAETPYDNRYYAEAKTCFWDLHTGMRIEGLEEGFRFPAAFSPDGKLVAAYKDDGLVFQEWESVLSQGSWREDPVWLTSWEPALSADGRTLVTQGRNEGVNVWDLQTGQVRSALAGRLEKTDRAALSPDGSTLAITGWSNPIQVWDLNSGDLLHYWQTRKPSFSQSIAFHPNGRVLAYSDKESVTLREIVTGKILQALDSSESSLKYLEFSRDNRSLVSEGYSYIFWWDLDWGRSMLRPRQIQDFGEVDGHKFGKITAQLINPANLTCILAENHSVGKYDYEKKRQDYDHLIHVIDLTTGRRLFQFEGENNVAVSLVADSEWETVASINAAGLIRKWDWRTGRLLLEFPGFNDPCYMNEIELFKISPNGKWVVVGVKGGILYFYDYNTGELLVTGYNLSAGFLWSTPPDEFAPNGWLFTNRPDLVSLLETNKVDNSKPEYLIEGDQRFDDYLRIYNDGEMVMTRLNDPERYRKLLQVRLGNKMAMDGQLLVQGELKQRFLPLPRGDGR